MEALGARVKYKRVVRVQDFVEPVGAPKVSFDVVSHGRHDNYEQIREEGTPLSDTRVLFMEPRLVLS